MNRTEAFRVQWGYENDLTTICELDLPGLAPIDPDTANKIPYQRMIERACQIFGITLEALHGRSGARLVMLARYAIAHVLHEVGFSYHRLAEVLKRSDHTTAINWVRQSSLYVEFLPYLKILQLLRDAWAFRTTPLKLAA